MATYIPELPKLLKPPIPDLTTLDNWKKCSTAGRFARRNNVFLLQIDEGIKRYHQASRLWDKYSALDKISSNATLWIKSKVQKKESNRWDAVNMLLKHCFALRRYPQLEQINHVVYRGSTRSPTEIFAHGFSPQKLHPPISIGTDGHTWESGEDTQSQIVSTSLRISVPIGHYARGGWVYALYARDGIDLRENGDYEIALLGVPRTDIIAAIGKLLGEQSVQAGSDDVAVYTAGSVQLVKGQRQVYFENPYCTVPHEFIHLARIWLKKLSGQHLDEEERMELFNHLRQMH